MRFGGLGARATRVFWDGYAFSSTSGLIRRERWIHYSFLKSTADVSEDPVSAELAIPGQEATPANVQDDEEEEDLLVSPRVTQNLPKTCLHNRNLPF